MQISYAIPVCNEHIELKKLLEFLTSYIDEDDEIIVQCDYIVKDTLMGLDDNLKL